MLPDITLVKETSEVRTVQTAKAKGQRPKGKWQEARGKGADKPDRCSEACHLCSIATTLPPFHHPTVPVHPYARQTAISKRASLRARLTGRGGPSQTVHIVHIDIPLYRQYRQFVIPAIVSYSSCFVGQGIGNQKSEIRYPTPKHVLQRRCLIDDNLTTPKKMK